MQVVYSRACSLVREVGRARLFRFSSPFSPHHTLRSRQAFLKVRPHFFFPPIVFSFRLSSSAREAAICLTVWFGLYIAREGARGLPQPIPLIQPNFAYHPFIFVHNHLHLHFCTYSWVIALYVSPFISPFDLSVWSPHCRLLRFLRVD